MSMKRIHMESANGIMESLIFQRHSTEDFIASLLTVKLSPPPPTLYPHGALHMLRQKCTFSSLP